MIHVVPINDQREHESGTQCWCDPTVSFDGGILVVHNSCDRRELLEASTPKRINAEKKWMVVEA